MARRLSDAPQPIIEAGNKPLSYSPGRAAREKAYCLSRAARSFLYVAEQIVAFINSCIRDL